MYEAIARYECPTLMCWLGTCYMNEHILFFWSEWRSDSMSVTSEMPDMNGDSFFKQLKQLCRVVEQVLKSVSVSVSVSLIYYRLHRIFFLPPPFLFFFLSLSFSHFLSFNFLFISLTTVFINKYLVTTLWQFMYKNFICWNNVTKIWRKIILPENLFDYFIKG